MVEPIKPIDAKFKPSVYYSLCFFAKLILIMMLSRAAPMKATRRGIWVWAKTWPGSMSNQLISMFSSPQAVFTRGEERPLPGGLAKGVGNLLPETPCTKWGMELAKNAPQKKAER